MHDATSEEDRRILQEIAGRAGAPAFIRRAKLVETTWVALLDHCARTRLEKLAFVRLRIGQLHALAGTWDALRSFVPDATDLARLKNLHDELAPSLRVPLEATTSRRVLRSAAEDLVEVMEMFNARWKRWLAKVDLKAVNQAREAYNRHYVLEKECAVGSARVARMHFVKLTPMTLDDVSAHFPLLVLPRFAF